MTLHNTRIRYGGVTKFFHWLTAFLILTLIALGFYASDLPHETQAQLTTKAWFFSMHKTLGVALFGIALLRIIWALGQIRPGLLNGDKRVESWLAQTVHWLLYASLIIVPLAGWVSHAAASGFAPIWWPFGQNLPFVPKDTTLEHVFGALHVIAGKILIATIILHVAGALKHHFIEGDSTLRRMLPGSPAIGPVPSQPHHRTPVYTAIAVWGATIFVGVGLGLVGGDGPTEAAEAPRLETVTSQWQVQSGTIGLGVTQFGSQVQGSFADWTSSISFDETVTSGKAGTVSTTVSIPSLSLGSVTDQAMGADFFNAEDFPTATFKAEIVKSADGYVANGTLTIKDQSAPVTLPFDLKINGDTAQMTGSTTLDRRNFGIGDSVTDESSLAFDVTATIQLTARQTP